MSQIQITLPDGSSKPFEAGANALDVAKSISPRLADAAIAAKIDGELRDLTEPIAKDAKVEILTSKSPESLTIYRHSTAHLMAAAVLVLFRDARPTIGPHIADGFYYDFELPRPFTE